MGQYKRPEKTIIDVSAWSRRGNFEFFRDFINPNLGVTVRVDVSHAYAAAKAKGVSFFLSYFYAILGAVNEIQEFSLNDTVFYIFPPVGTGILL